MITHLQPEISEPVVFLGDTLVYSQRREWCSATYRQLSLSIMRTRTHFSYDEKTVLPVLLFACGGGFTQMDRNVWMPELTYFAKNGWAMVGVDYGATARTRFPEPVEDIKAAIRWLRAHEKELLLDTDRMVIMGESAGGYMSTFTAVSGETREYDRGDHLEYSSAVSGAVSYYPANFPAETYEGLEHPSEMRRQYPDPRSFITENTPPVLFLHGTADSQVQLFHSERVYHALQEKGVRSEMLVLEGVEHADVAFFQPYVKEKVLAFINSL